ncbi:uncharacterized protein CLUP02_11870 [Colletotrichum lupini]|uniref:Uncharacterized protein n=1 Tax=Colletotrichum lupini TaxID=145971 RepID=A0A9Q8SZS8_9PEZI|nr:uncharacterized protein CLUP02_11870 [Colletotrichum lupini]UQC86370.1 hypothetical protein CLUP02_11870 [Colletotrichum lupini]
MSRAVALRQNETKSKKKKSVKHNTGEAAAVGGMAFQMTFVYFVIVAGEVQDEVLGQAMAVSFSYLHQQFPVPLSHVIGFWCFTIKEMSNSGHGRLTHIKPRAEAQKQRFSHPGQFSLAFPLPSEVWLALLLRVPSLAEDLAEESDCPHGENVASVDVDRRGGLGWENPYTPDLGAMRFAALIIRYRRRFVFISNARKKSTRKDMKLPDSKNEITQVPPSCEETRRYVGKMAHQGLPSSTREKRDKDLKHYEKTVYPIDLVSTTKIALIIDTRRHSRSTPRVDLNGLALADSENNLDDEQCEETEEQKELHNLAEYEELTNGW